MVDGKLAVDYLHVQLVRGNARSRLGEYLGLFRFVRTRRLELCLGREPYYRFERLNDLAILHLVLGLDYRRKLHAALSFHNDARAL